MYTICDIYVIKAFKVLFMENISFLLPWASWKCGVYREPQDIKSTAVYAPHLHEQYISFSAGTIILVKCYYYYYYYYIFCII